MSAENFKEAPEAKETEKKVRIVFRTPAELRAYNPPKGFELVGDFHVVKGSVFVIGGAPGVGKSRAAVALALAGATQRDWFGHRVHRTFKTMIIQNENGSHRLKKELTEIGKSMDDCVLISDPPPYGMGFNNLEFREQVKAAIATFKPDVLFIDPWTAAVRGQKQEDYTEAFEWIQSVVPQGDDKPAIGIIAHTRKPRPDERASGRGLLNLLAGSYVLGSVPRSAFVMQAASDDVEDDRLIMTCCKNNDGEMGPRSAWRRQNGLFKQLAEFDWEEFDSNGKSKTIQKSDACELLCDEFTGLISKAKAVEFLADKSKKAESTMYRWIEQLIKSKDLQEDDNGFLILT
jgi:hypothetical protein